MPFTFCVDEENYDGSLEHFTFRRGEEEQYMAMRMAGLVYGVRGTPTLFLVDKEGIVREHHEGSMNFKELEDLVRPYL